MTGEYLHIVLELAASSGGGMLQHINKCPKDSGGVMPSLLKRLMQ